MFPNQQFNYAQQAAMWSQYNNYWQQAASMNQTSMQQPTSYSQQFQVKTF